MRISDWSSDVCSSDLLGVATQPTRMSFSVHAARSGLEYNAENLDTLFCQRRNLLSPPFWRMVRDITRFYREAPALLQSADGGPSLGAYLEQIGRASCRERVGQ